MSGERASSLRQVYAESGKPELAEDSTAFSEKRKEFKRLIESNTNTKLIGELLEVVNFTHATTLNVGH